MILGKECNGEGVGEGLTCIPIHTRSYRHQKIELILDRWQIIELHSSIGMPDIIQMQVDTCVWIVFAVIG